MAGAPPSGGFGAGLESLLGNPLIQTALAGYLGAIGSPRYKGLGGALSQGGLTGLEAFSQAEALKQKAPLVAAQTQAALGKVPEEQAQTGYIQAKTTQLAGSKDDAAQMMMLAQNPNFSPSSRAIFQSLAPVVGGGRMKFADAFKIAQSGDLNAARIAAEQATTTERQAQTNYTKAKETTELPAEVAEKQASAEKSRAEEAAVPSLVSLRGAEAERAMRPPASATVKPKQVSALDLEKQASAEAEKSWAAAGVKEHWLGNHDAYVDAFKKNWMSQHGGGSVAALPPDKLPTSSAGGASPKDAIAADLGL